MIEEQLGPEPRAPVEHHVYRSKTNRVIAGVCGGLGEYLRIDPVLLRIAFLVLLFVGGGGVLLYILAWIVMPEGSGSGDQVASLPSAHQARLIVGGALVLLGALMLGRLYMSWIDARIVWSLVLMAVGALIVMKGIER